MSASAAKRRKTSPTTSVAVDASNTQSNPSTPKRASFQSPTKASLARSHPNLLPQSAERNQVQTRGQGLRQELLSRRTSRSAPKPSTAGPETPKQQNELARNRPADLAAVGAESLSGAIRTLFNADPSTLPASSRTPLRARQPPIRLVDSQSRIDDLQSAKQLQPEAHRSRPPSNKDAENDEPDLPPTPVQLGLNEQPDRPRGLASSSPGRSSGSNRQRTRLDESRHTSSPSKLRGQGPQLGDSGLELPATRPNATGAEVADEAPESDVETPAEDEVPLIPAEVLHKRSLHDSISAQLTRLQSELASLENSLTDSDKDNSRSGDIDSSLLALLTSTNPSCAEVTLDNDEISCTFPTVPKPTALGSEPLPYLTLFAPGHLQLHSTTKTSIVGGRPHQVHVLELSAPEPWPAHVFGATIRVTVDVQETQITNVEVIKMRPGTGHQWLRDWLKRRLESERSLHRYDVGGLVWGFGTWWEGCVTRAERWRMLEERFINNKISKTAKDTEGAAEVLDEEDVTALLPHIARTSMQFELGATKRVTRSKKEAASQKPDITKVMLLWNLLLDWTGEVEETVGVAVAGIGRTGEQSVKDVFGKFYNRDGVLQAVEGVLGVLATGTVNQA